MNRSNACSIPSSRHGGKAGQTSQVAIIGIGVAWGPPPGADDLGPLYSRCNGRNYLLRNFILELKDILQCAVKAVCPSVGSARRFDQLCRNSQSASSLAHTPFEDNIEHQDHARPAVCPAIFLYRQNSNCARSRTGIETRQRTTAERQEGLSGSANVRALNERLYRRCRRTTRIHPQPPRAHRLSNVFQVLFCGPISSKAVSTFPRI